MPGFKRKRVYAPKNGMRSKRFRGKKRTFRRKSWSTTSKSGVARNYNFRARKISKRSWNGMLWRSTLQKSHYRSNTAGSNVLNTNISASVYNVAFLNALQIGANAFWTTLGGAQPLDLGATVPGFSGDIILRGGTIGLTLANDTADATPQKIEVFLVKTGDEYDTTGFPGSVPVGYDPTMFPDFNTSIGRIVMRKEVMLENVNTADIRFRLSIRKIDAADYALEKNTYIWILFANSPSGTSSTFTATHYFNLSFAADAV